MKGGVGGRVVEEDCMGQLGRGDASGEVRAMGGGGAEGEREDRGEEGGEGGEVGEGGERIGEQMGVRLALLVLLVITAFTEVPAEAQPERQSRQRHQVADI